MQRVIDIVLWPLEEKHFESKNVTGHVSDTSFWKAITKPILQHADGILKFIVIRLALKMETLICHKLRYELLVKPSSSFPALKLKFLKDINKCLQLTDGDIGH